MGKDVDGVPSRNMRSGLTSMAWQLYYQLADHARTLESVAVYDFGAATSFLFSLNGIARFRDDTTIETARAEITTRALGGSRWIQSLLYQVSPRDPIVFAATTVFLLTVALLACWPPARRAARLSPLEALRSD
jgi:ABC-type lipoprotein release transport system permease subunit